MHSTPAILTLTELLALPRHRIAELDIGRINLLCAQGLPGAEALNIAACLATLDRWAEAVGRYTADGFEEFCRDPESYGGHEGFFRFLMMVNLLKHPSGLGIGYQPKAIGNNIFSDSRDDFLHGPLTRRLGTCASLPVLFVGIGRRLGYPMHLALAKGHVLCQWAGGEGAVLNLEGSCPGGGSMLPDEYYHQWPRPMNPADLASGKYLRPLTRAEELALFLESRGHCLVDNRSFADARQAYAQARHVAPQWADYDNHIYSLELHEAACTPEATTSPKAITPMTPPQGVQTGILWGIPGFP